MKNLILLISISVALSCQQNKKIETIVVKQEVSIFDPDIRSHKKSLSEF